MKQPYISHYKNMLRASSFSAISGVTLCIAWCKQILSYNLILVICARTNAAIRRVAHQINST